MHYTTNNNKFKFAGAYGLCIGVVFGTAASYFGKSSSKSYVNIMSKYITSSAAVSIVALLSIQGLIKPSNKTKQAAQQQTPLQHLKLLNYQSFSISSIPSNISMKNNIHSRSI